MVTNSYPGALKHVISKRFLGNFCNISISGNLPTDRQATAEMLVPLNCLGSHSVSSSAHKSGHHEFLRIMISPPFYLHSVAGVFLIEKL